MQLYLQLRGGSGLLQMNSYTSRLMRFLPLHIRTWTARIPLNGIHEVGITDHNIYSPCFIPDNNSVIIILSKIIPPSSKVEKKPNYI